MPAGQLRLFDPSKPPRWPRRLPTVALAPLLEVIGPAVTGRQLALSCGLSQRHAERLIAAGRVSIWVADRLACGRGGDSAAVIWPEWAALVDQWCAGE